jgi:hypothetical protein
MSTVLYTYIHIYIVCVCVDLGEVGWDGRDWIDLAQNRNRWRAHVNAVMNLRVPQMLGISVVAVQLVASQEGLSSMSE